MIDNAYPYKETNQNPLGVIPDYEDNQNNPNVVNQKAAIAPPPVPQTPITAPPPPQTPTTEDEYINSLQPASYTAYNPGTIEKADDIYNQSYNDYVNSLSDQSILDKSRKLMNFYSTNKPNPEKSMSDFDNRVKATLISRALNDLTSSIGSAAGNKGGRANIKEKNFSAFDDAYKTHMNAVREKGVRDYNQKVQDFQVMLDQMGKENQMLNNRDVSALEYAEKARENFKNNNKVTYNNSAALQKAKLEYDAKKRAEDHKNNIEVARIRSKGNKNAGGAGGVSRNTPLTESKKNTKESSLTRYENIFKNGIAALKSGKIVKAKNVVYVDKDGKKIKDTGQKQSRRFTDDEIKDIENIWYKSKNKRDAIMKLELEHPEIFKIGKNAADIEGLFQDFFAE